MSIKDANKIKIRRYKNKVVLLSDKTRVKCSVEGVAVDIADKPKEKSARTLRKEAKYKARKEAQDKYEILDPKLDVRTTKASGYFTTCNTKTGKSKMQKWRTQKGDFTRKPTPLIKGDKMPSTQPTHKAEQISRGWDKHAKVPLGGIAYKRYKVDKAFRTEW